MDTNSGALFLSLAITVFFYCLLIGFGFHALFDGKHSIIEIMHCIY